MTSSKWTILCLIALMAGAICSAQQKFPLRPGEWTSTTSAPAGHSLPPSVFLFCMNDELWTKALAQNPSCVISQFNITSSGGSYALDCPMKSVHMKGNVNLTFDGMTHMISNASLDAIMNGRTTHMESTSDFRWKGPTCDPNADLNLKLRKLPSQ